MGRFTLNAKQIAIALTVFGGLLACIGIGLIYFPASMVVGGVAMTCLGLFAEFDK
jgi:hypothetical protein